MKFYVAMTEKSMGGAIAQPGRPRAARVLVSYPYVDTMRDMFGRYVNERIPMMLDCGAFTAFMMKKQIDLGKYMRVARTLTPVMENIAALDVIGDAEASFRNYQTMINAGLTVMPSVHYGASAEELTRYADAGATYVGLGGLVPYLKSPRLLLPWLDTQFAQAGKLGLKVHGYGVSTIMLWKRYPWYSCDSSAPSAGARYGMIPTYEGGRIITRHGNFHHLMIPRIMGLYAYYAAVAAVNRIKGEQADDE